MSMQRLAERLKCLLKCCYFAMTATLGCEKSDSDRWVGAVQLPLDDDGRLLELLRLTRRVLMARNV